MPRPQSNVFRPQMRQPMRGMQLVFPHIDVRAGEVQIFPKVLSAVTAALYHSPLPPVIVCTLPTDREHESNVRRFELYLNRRRKGTS